MLLFAAELPNLYPRKPRTSNHRKVKGSKMPLVRIRSVSCVKIIHHLFVACCDRRLLGQCERHWQRLRCRNNMSIGSPEPRHIPVIHEPLAYTSVPQIHEVLISSTRKTNASHWYRGLIRNRCKYFSCIALKPNISLS